MKKSKSLQLCLSYAVSLGTLALLATIGYAGNLDLSILRFFSWAALLIGTVGFIKKKLYVDVLKMRFPLYCLVAMSLFSCAFAALDYNANSTYIPDPQPMDGRNYQVLNVKVLNIAQTNANDNYVPYRQAQFFIHRSDPAKDDFIAEWGVNFFQRTPLMGAVTASYFNLLDDKPPVGFLWNIDAKDPDFTYAKFQIIAQILNSLFILPGYFLLKKFFGKRTAMITCLFIVTSSFYLYNSVFSWPKSLVGFFVLSMWILLFRQNLRSTIVAGVLGGLAYLTHDLGIFYVVASLGLLLVQKRLREAIWFSSIIFIFALPWLLLSSLVYKNPSTFALYPFSIHGLPQGSKRQIFNDFINTPIREIISIRFDTFFYLMSPYDLLYSGGGQPFLRRLWAVGLFSIPGSMGLGLIVPAIIGAVKRLAKLDFWILISIPILLATGIVGWRGSRAIASLHFAEPIVILLAGLGIAWLLKLKRLYWLYLVWFINTIYLVFFVLYSYGFSPYGWLNDISDSFSLFIMLVIVCGCGALIFRVTRKRVPPWLSNGSIA